MPKYHVDLKLDNLEIEAENRTDAMFIAKEALPSEFWPYIASITSKLAPGEAKKKEKPVE